MSVPGAGVRDGESGMVRAAIAAEHRARSRPLGLFQAGCPSSVPSVESLIIPQSLQRAN